MTTQITELQFGQQIVDGNGQATLEMVEIMQRLAEALAELQAFKTGVAAVTKPTGGATIDAEARTAIDAMIDLG